MSGFPFDGPDLTQGDVPRLFEQLKQVYDVMTDGGWHTIDDVSRRVKGLPISVSTRMRDLRKTKFGGHEVEKRPVCRGLWEYRMKVNDRTAKGN